MRIGLAVVLVTSLASGGAGCSGGDAGMTPDGRGADDGPLDPPTRGFQIMGPNVEVAPRKEVTFCYYFRTPNTGSLAIRKWQSRMTAGVRQMIVYFTPTEQAVAGTLSASQCGFIGVNSIGPVWTYSAVDANAEAAMPADDGHGVPVGQIVPAGQYGFIQMHFQNATDAPIRPHVELNGHAYDEGVTVTPAAPFVTYNQQIDLAPAKDTVTPTTGMVTGRCTVASDAKFFLMSTQTYKQGTEAIVRDATEVVFRSTRWDHPPETRWNAPSFRTFQSGTLTYECQYSNPNTYRIRSGDNIATDETCVAIGYYFPATDAAGHLCLDSAMIY